MQTSKFAQIAKLRRAEVLAVHSAVIAVITARIEPLHGYTEKMMSDTESHSSQAGGPADADADWRQLEAFVEQLHERSRAPIAAHEFYRELLEGCVALLAAEGAVVWVPGGRGRWRAMHRIHDDAWEDCDSTDTEAARFALLRTAAGAAGPLVVAPKTQSAGGGENATALATALVAVRDEDVQAVIELFMRPGMSPAVQQGWQELLATIAEIAAEFHIREQLRSLRTERGFYDRALGLMRRFQRTTNLKQTAFEVANDGRKFVGGDRLSVLVKRGTSWHLLATSGVDRVEPRADAVQRLQLLAEAVAGWGEPLDYADVSSVLADELPPDLAQLVEQHVDESQARRFVAAPIEFGQLDEDHSRPRDIGAVVVAEQFTSDEGEFSHQRVLELAELCQPALRQAMQLDRFPVRSCLRWADRWAELREQVGLTRLSVGTLAAVAIALALVFVKIDFEVEAPATLRPALERDIFATADGKVVDVQIQHGDRVSQGDVLAVIDDPQLALDAQRVVGEIETTRKRLEAIAVARTDRQVREETNNDKLPLSAEAEQLEKSLTSLQLQQQILQRRREALTLRSPIEGVVLTLDVQNLLQTRPVERGQILFTVANTSAGWQLSADLPQDRLGQVVAAAQDDAKLPVRFRLAGDTEHTYPGHVDSISTAAVLDTAGLDQESPTFEVVVDVEADNLATARPGMNAQVRILCGRRSLGYVWLHDVWETVYSWLVF
ncbi:MAG: efflux RND transporter periplasmic adaptor subunit [Bythopirellula sp.]